VAKKNSFLPSSLDHSSLLVSRHPYHHHWKHPGKIWSQWYYTFYCPTLLQFYAGMGKIEKGGDLESQNLGIKNCSRNTGIEKSSIGLVKISPFRMKKFEINETK
jgi:hypothetical protein